MICDSDALISKREALDAICDNCDTEGSSCAFYPCGRYTAVEKLLTVQPSLHGYRFEQLATIANILHKEGLPPERVSEALTDVDRIVAIVRAEFEEELKKAIERQLNITDMGET